METVRLLLDAALGSTRQRDRSGQTPLELLLMGGQVAEIALELGVRDPPATLALLRAARQRFSPALLDQIATSLPLSAIERASLPPAILVAALPAALAHSPSQAGLLVKHLPDQDRARLCTLALCMARVQRSAGTPLPLQLVQGILLLAARLLCA